ncbi:hypothetical protein BOX15_Mlig009419g1 [Macrostomum lignano]|uniref:Thyroglobulin type-1 domain-containing protein n=1 Tax=Macrostomum lignano TaxID=282301 RepID=A0A267FE73_9PLAT|nr:hypothetical protein BOX15_Mlig009419g1 [Macrostomum lignano]
MYLAAPIFLVFVTVFQFVVGSLGPATLPPLRMLPKLSPGPGGGATSGLAPPPQPPPRPPDASTSDDEDLAVAKAGGASGDRPWPLGPLGGASSGDAWPPAPHQPNATVGGPWTQRPTVRIELPVARTSTAKPWQPWQPRPTPANNGRNCSNQPNQVIQTMQGLRYRPICQSQRPELYRDLQCGSGACFCVDVLTGEMIEATAVSVSQKMSCSSAAFSVSLGFEVNWQESMARQSSASFHEFAQKIEAELDGLFREFQGRQMARVLRLRPGSVIADIRLTSIGHVPSLDRDVQELKQLLDSRVASRKFAGMPVALRHYAFRREDQLNRSVDSNAPDQPGRAAGSGQGGWQGSNESPSDRNGQQQHQQNESDGANSGTDNQQQQQQQLSAASLLSSPGVLAAAIAGGVGCLLLVALLAMFCIYRSRKASGGSYKTNGVSTGRPGVGAGGGGSVGFSNGSNGGKKVIYTQAATQEYFA